MQHRDEIIIKKIIDEIDIALDMTKDKNVDVFVEDEILKRAVTMTTINVGELIKNISNDLKEEYKELPWKAAAGMRDVAAHKYQTLRMEDVYNTVKSDFPKLKEQMKDIIKKG